MRMSQNLLNADPSAFFIFGPLKACTKLHILVPALCLVYTPFAPLLVSLSQPVSPSQDIGSHT